MADIRLTNIPGVTLRDPRRIQGRKAGIGEDDAIDLRPPHRAKEDTIPSPELLGILVRLALKALGKGMLWDRGSIVNIRV